MQKRIIIFGLRSGTELLMIFLKSKMMFLKQLLRESHHQSLEKNKIEFYENQLRTLQLGRNISKVFAIFMDASELNLKILP